MKSDVLLTRTGRGSRPPQHLADLDPAERRGAAVAAAQPAYRAEQLSRHYFARYAGSPSATAAPRRSAGSRSARCCGGRLPRPVRVSNTSDFIGIQCHTGPAGPARGQRHHRSDSHVGWPDHRPEDRVRTVRTRHTYRMATVVFGPRPPELETWLGRRRELGQDRCDEVWEGDYHVVPGPSAEHAFVDSQLAHLLWPRAEQAGLSVTTAFNLGEPDDYRVPDGGVHRNRPSGVFVATTAMVVEVVSPGDETLAKLTFY